MSPGSRTGSTASLRRGDPHGAPARDAAERERLRNAIAQLRGQTPQPDAAVEPLPEVVVTGTNSGVSDTSLSTPLGPIQVGAPGTLPFNQNLSPLRPTPGPTPAERLQERLNPPEPPTPRPLPSESFAGPEPLPEVTVQTQRQTPLKPPPIGFDFFGIGPLLARGAFGVFSRATFFMKPTPANVGENDRVRKQIADQLAQSLLPVNVSVSRLADPMPEVTVTGSRPSTARSTRTTPRLSRVELPGGLRAVGVDRIASPTPRPARQNPPKPKAGRVGSFVIPGLGPTIVGPAPYVRPLPLATPTPSPSSPSSPSRPGQHLPGVRPSNPPFLDPGRGLDPLPLPFGQPNRLSPKNCSCAETKPRRPRKPRLSCHTGTYTETSTGLIKQPTRSISCR